MAEWLDDVDIQVPIAGNERQNLGYIFLDNHPVDRVLDRLKPIDVIAD